MNINVAGYILKDSRVEEAIKMGMPLLIWTPTAHRGVLLGLLKVFNPDGGGVVKWHLRKGIGAFA